MNRGIRAWLLSALMLPVACACPEARASGRAAQPSARDALVGAWVRPGPKGARDQWLVLDGDGSASLIDVQGVWGVSWRVDAPRLVLTVQAPDDPAPRELAFTSARVRGERLELKAPAASGAAQELAGRWKRRAGGILAISGTISVSERIALPPDAVLRVVLQEAERDDVPALTLAARDMPVDQGKFPLKYLLHVPEPLVDRNRAYVVRARVAAAGVQRYVAADTHEVLTLGAPPAADIVLTPAQPPARMRPPPPAPVAAQIVTLEAAFAAHARASGTKAAFLEVLAADSIVLQPGPVFGRAAYETGEDLQGLDWTPDRTQGSADGDLGIATGPWLYMPSASKPRLEGRYFTVWRRQAEGWKVIFDGGFGRAAKADARLPSPVPVLDYGECERGAPVEVAELQRLDADLSGGPPGATGPGAAAAADSVPHSARVAARAGANLAWFEEPAAEGVTGKAALARISRLPARLSLRPMGGAVAASGDLAYTYGLIEPSAGATATGAYAHGWCRQQGDWKLILVLRRRLGPG